MTYIGTGARGNASIARQWLALELLNGGSLVWRHFLVTMVGRNVGNVEIPHVFHLHKKILLRFSRGIGRGLLILSTRGKNLLPGEQAPSG